MNLLSNTKQKSDLHLITCSMANAKLKKVKSTIVKSYPSVPRAMLTPKTINYMRDMLECLPPAELKQTLIRVFFIYLEHEHERLPTNFDKTISDYYMLFDFLDKIEAEMKEK